MGVLRRLSNTFVEVEQIIKKFNLAIIDFFSDKIQNGF